MKYSSWRISGAIAICTLLGLVRPAHPWTETKKPDVSTERIELLPISAPAKLPPFPDELELEFRPDEPRESGDLKSSNLPDDTKSSDSSSVEVAFEDAVKAQLAKEHFDKAETYVQEEKWPEAISEYVLAIKAQPRDFTIRQRMSKAETALALQLERSGDKVGAMKHWHGAVYIDQANDAANEGLERFLRSLGLDSNRPEVRRNLAEEAMKSGDLEAAIVEWRALVRLQDNAESHALLGRALLDGGKIVDGYLELRKAVTKYHWTDEQEEQFATYHRELADILRQYMYGHYAPSGVKRMANAYIEYRRALFLNPDDSKSREGILEMCRQAECMREHQPSFLNYLALGSAFLLNGDLKHAAEAYNKCKLLEPTNPRLIPATKMLEAAEKMQSR